MNDPKPPPERDRTPRKRVLDALGPVPKTVRDVSAMAGLAERQVLDQLPHVQRSLKAKGIRLKTDPAACLACGFVFAKRERPGKPSSCPVCSSTRIRPPAFSIPADVSP